MVIYSKTLLYHLADLFIPKPSLINWVALLVNSLGGHFILQLFMATLVPPTLYPPSPPTLDSQVSC